MVSAGRAGDVPLHADVGGSGSIGRPGHRAAVDAPVQDAGCRCGQRDEGITGRMNASQIVQLLWLIPALPLAGFVLLTLFGDRLSRRAITWVGVGSVGSAALITGLVGTAFLQNLSESSVYRQTLWTWIETSGLSVAVTLNLDALSLLMAAVITAIGFLIHVYSTEYMRGDEGYRRFFAYMNLFVAS